MSDQQQHDEILFEKVIAEVKHTEPSEESMKAAADRVWARISAERSGTPRIEENNSAALSNVLRGQSDYEALFADYHRQVLPPAKRELLEARIREDVSTRLAWQEFKAAQEGRLVSFGAKPKVRKATGSGRTGGWLPRWAALAAMLALTAGLSWYGWNAWGPAQLGPQATVQMADQPLYVVRGARMETVSTGMSIAANEQVRVPEGGNAVLVLRDGSLVELRENTSFRLYSFGNNLTVHLYGGDVIVEAAKRSDGHLFVESRDMRVAVTGTVFTVGTGVKGSRVGVVEGSVQVAQGNRKLALKPGQQYASANELTPVPVDEQIAWSQNFEKHLALMRSLTALESELAAMRLPSLRYSSTLAKYLPESTVIYASVPNLEDPIRQAREILSGRLQQDAALREWMESHDGKMNVDTLLAELQGLSRFAGEEILLIALRNGDGKPGAPTVVSELSQNGFAEYLAQRLSSMTGDTPGPQLQVYSDLAALRQAPEVQGLHVSVAGSKLVLGPDLAVVKQIAAMLLSGEPGGFLEGDFGQRVQATYRHGAGFFLAADISGLVSGSVGAGNKGAEFTGIDDLRFLEVEQRQLDGQTDLRSTFTFANERHGVASWLAAPGALRALEFITPSATAVSAAMVKDPVAMLEDVMQAMGAAGQELSELEAKLNLRLRDDLAAPLGNEMAIALDGPLVPVPGWKLVLQINDPVRLRTTVERLLEAVNRESALHGKAPATLQSEMVDGLEFHTITFPTAGKLTTAHFAFSQGYLVAAPDRALVRQAIQTQLSGASILSHAAFRNLIPTSTSTGFSGVFFQQAGSSLSSVAKEVSALAGGDKAQAKAMEEMIRELKPTLVAAYASSHSMTISSKDGLFGLGGSSMLRMGALIDRVRGAKHGNMESQ